MEPCATATADYAPYCYPNPNQINGILRRAAIDKGGDVDDTERENQVSRSYLRIGVIPGGSTDALAYRDGKTCGL